MIERKKEYTRRLRMKLKSELNGKNKITEIRPLALPVLRCTLVCLIGDIEEKKILKN